MREQDFAVTVWEEPRFQMPQTVYLDATFYRAFLDWLAKDENARTGKLKSGAWRVVLFTSQLSRLFGADDRRNEQLRKVGIQLEAMRQRDRDEMYVSEVTRVFFQGDPNARTLAEFLTLCRRHALRGGSAERLAILSQHRAFRRVPMVNTFFLADCPLVGNDDLPAQFDFFVDFRIHREVQKVAVARLSSGDHPTAVVEAAKSLSAYLRACANLSTDGRSLVEQALKQDGSYIKLNPLSNESEENEQRGYREFCMGVVGAFRNPLSHLQADEQFVTQRFGEKQKALKALSLLSLIFERLDQRVP